MSAAAWTRHAHDDGRRHIWLESGRLARAVAADTDGVHPRLTKADHESKAVLRDWPEVIAYIEQRDLAPTDEAAVLLTAAAVVAHLRRSPCHTAA